MDGIGMNAIKYLLFFFNMIFLLSGVGIITAGAVVLSEVYPFNHFLEGRLLIPPIILIVVGTIIFLIAFLGCYGAIRENFIMLIAFAVALVIIFLIEMGIGVAAAVYKNDFPGILKKSLKDSLNRNSNADKLAWANIQRALQCCGVESKNDWDGIMPDETLPRSCCPIVDDNSVSTCSQKSDNVFQEACFLILRHIIIKNANLLIGVGIGIAFVEIAGIVLACCLAMAIRREDNK
ncbi:hypothetical protein PV327_010206 [Microctonus hyperodae]|uniref:Tetraspanin n=1 Tax=Microctonus hyperodae TaxID=165561 RepID=A0AA39FRE2_MICHY|nr:hypothetical protein PV327_010206 [Microctonus hyperodae]